MVMYIGMSLSEYKLHQDGLQKASIDVSPFIIKGRKPEKCISFSYYDV